MTQVGAGATGPTPADQGEGLPYPPMDGRDLSRVRTEVRLAQLALIGLLTEEQESPPGKGTHSRVMNLVARAEVGLADVIEVLGEALATLNEEHGH